MTLPQPKYRADIDGLRAVAVLSVVAFHAFPDAVVGGFIGVDVFFVISGYLISTIILNGLAQRKFSFGEFYSRRIRRIFPALIVVLIACFAIGRLVLMPSEFRQMGKHLAAGAGFVSNLAFWREASYFDVNAATRPLLHLWSLGIEEQFYIIWPLVLLLVWKLRRRLLLPAILATMAGSFLVNVVTIGHDATAAFYSPLARFWELFAGVSLAYFAVHKLPPVPGVSVSQQTGVPARSADVLSLLGLMSILFAVLYLDVSRQFPGWWAALPVVGAYCLIAAGPGAFVNRTLLSNPVMVWFGLISFPLYLWHWPLLAFAHISAGRAPAWPVRAMLVLLSVLLAWLTFELIEKRTRHRQGKTTVIVLCAGMIAIGVVGGLMRAKGMFARATTPTQRLLVEDYDTATIYRYKECFLDCGSQGPEQYSSHCLELAAAGATPHPLVMLWGDSHAAQFYPGLSQLRQENRFDLAQRTASSCPPLIGGFEDDNGRCAEINVANRAYIRNRRPTVVVMGSRWSRDAAGLEDKVRRTVAFLRSAGVERIVIMGPPPHWAPTLRDLLFREVSNGTAIPTLLPPPAGDFAEVVALDRRLKTVSAAVVVDYVSLVDTLCEGSRCLVRIGDTIPDDLITGDYDHLTANASRYLVSMPAIRALLPDGSAEPQQ